MKLLYVLLLNLILVNFSFAGEVINNCKSDTFKKSLKSNCYMKFDMESTKAGMITTAFTGVVKNIQTAFNWNGSEFANALIKFNVKDMDTDNDSRDEKMYEKSFESDKHPIITVQIGGPLTAGSHQGVDALMTVRGQRKEIKVNLETSVNPNGYFVISGNSSVSLKALGIPDPSIWIASVRDRVDIKFKLIGNIK
ncbi:MAG: YceI family protein [Bacteriovoracaceae bacterium]|nr:YceI family protein [Bacteriovoracaceae bacterium]